MDSHTDGHPRTTDRRSGRYLGDDGDGNLFQDIARSERAEVVHTALRELPGDQRRALELAFFGGLSHREIAERTETPLGPVKTRIRTALLKLRERLATELET